MGESLASVAGVQVAMLLMNFVNAPSRACRCALSVAAIVVMMGTAFAQSPPSAPSAQAGAGDINLSPKRVVFDPAGHAQTVYIFNRGNGPATYRVSLVDRVMLRDGRLLVIDNDLSKDAVAIAAKVKSAKDLVVYSPRRVTLQPGESQTIRLRAVKPATLTDGEYRTHLTVTEVPPEDLGLTAEQAATQLGARQLSVRVVPLFSISIPVIVRQGTVDVRAGIESMRLSTERAAQRNSGAATAVLTLDLVRLGSDSAFGNIEVRQAENLLGEVRGVAVYPEVDRRAVTIALSRVPRSGDKLTVSFVDDDSKTGTELAKATLVAP